MGWPFGGRKKTYVSTSVSRVVEDNLLPDLVSKAVIQSIFANESLSGNIVDGILNSFALDVEGALRYARTDYAYGMPEVNYLDDNLGETEVLEGLKLRHGPNVIIDYHHFASLHPVHIAMQWLINVGGYDPDTNIISGVGESQYTYYLGTVTGVINTLTTEFEDATENGEDLFYYPDPGLMEGSWETIEPNRRFMPQTMLTANNGLRPFINKPMWQFRNDGQESAVEITATRHIESGENGFNFSQYFIIDLDTPEFNLDDAYFQTKYRHFEDGFWKTKYFTYRYGEGTYAPLEFVADQNKDTHEFMPFVFLRQGRQDRTADIFKDTEEYKTSTKFLKKLGMDYKEMGAALAENPDASKVEQGVMLWGIPLNTESERGQEYLYQFWDWVASREAVRGNLLNTNDIEEIIRPPPSKGITFQDKDFRLQLSYGNISKLTRTGVIAPKIGDVRVVLNLQPATYPVKIDDLSDETINVTRSIHSFYIQTGEFTYDTIHVSSISSLYRIVDKDVVIDSLEDEGRLLIPLSTTIVNANFTFIEKDTLYAEAMHMVFNSRVVKKMPWYTTEFFQIILAIIAIVIIIFTWGSTTGAVTSAFASLSATYGVVVGAVLVALKYVVISYASSYALSFVAKELGPEYALAIGVLGIFVGSVGALNNAAWATNLIGLSTNLVNAGNDQFAIETSKYLSEQQEFELLAEEKYDELQDTIDDMANKNLLDPYDIIGRVPRTILGESPTSFYDRTVHIGNIGAVGPGMIEHFVESNLKLPSFDETINNFGMQEIEPV